jgi:hypothetical protein
MVRYGYMTYPQRMYTYALRVNTRSAPHIRCATGSCITYRRFPSSDTRSAEIISILMDALHILTDASGTTPSLNTLRGLAISTHTFARCWQHARGLRLALAFIRPTLATCSGSTPHIGIHSPGVGNTLGGYTSYWHSYIHPTLAIRSGVASSNPMLATCLRTMLTC